MHEEHLVAICVPQGHLTYAWECRDKIKPSLGLLEMCHVGRGPLENYAKAQNVSTEQEGEEGV